MFSYGERDQPEPPACCGAVLDHECVATVCVNTGRPLGSLLVIRCVSVTGELIKVCVGGPAGWTATDLSLIGWGGNL